jgi:hypothetical protein
VTTAGQPGLAAYPQPQATQKETDVVVGLVAVAMAGADKKRSCLLACLLAQSPLANPNE